MSLFLMLIIVGLFGMALMAFPAFGRHGQGIAGHAHAGHLPAGHATAAHVNVHPSLPPASHLPTQIPSHISGGIARVPAQHVAPATNAPATASGNLPATPNGQAAAGNASALTRFIPSPRMIFSLMAAYGAFGYLLVETLHMASLLAYWVAVVPAVLLERFVLTPFWNLLLGFQSRPCTPVEQMVMSEAEAVTPFRNGKGIVRAVRDGRDIQFSAQLPPSQAHLPVRVGDRLRIEEVAANGEHVKVTLEP